MQGTPKKKTPNLYIVENPLSVVECALTVFLQAVLGNTVLQIAQINDDLWRFLSFDQHEIGSILNRKEWYNVLSHICKPLLIGLARLFFSIFRNFLKASFPIVDITDIRLHFHSFDHEALMSCRILVFLKSCAILFQLILLILLLSNCLWTSS